MKFLDKIKDLFSDEEEVIETQEIEIEEAEEEHQLPTFMRNKIEEEQKREEERKQRELEMQKPAREMVSDREIVRTRSNNNFSFPMDIDMDEPVEPTPVVQRQVYSNQNVLQREVPREKKPVELYSKKEEPKPKKFKPTPVISPVYGVLDKNYTKDEVRVSDEKNYELQRPSRKVDFETVRNKAFGSLTDDIRNNLCENCELYQEVKITKAADLKSRGEKEEDLLADIKEDVSLGTAEENYFDFGVDYEIPTREDTKVSITRTRETEEIKIVNHNDEESTAEKIEVKEEPVAPKIVETTAKKNLEDTKEFDKITRDEESADMILEGLTDLSVESSPENDIFNLIDSMYDEEEK